MRWHIGEYAGRREPGLERERIGERLECRARLARCQRPIDRPAVLRIRVVTGSLPGQPLAASVVQHDDRDVGGAVPLERLPVAPDDADDVGLESGIEGGLDARREIRPAFAVTISTKCGARKGDGVREKRKRSSFASRA